MASHRVATREAHVRTTLLTMAAALVVAGCGGAGVDVAAGRGGPIDPTTDEAVGDLHDDGLLAGVPDTCRLLEQSERDPLPPADRDLAAVLVERIGPADGRGPLVGVEDDTGRLTVAATLLDAAGRKGDVAVWELDPATPGTALVARNEAAATRSDVALEPMPNPVTAAAAEATDCAYVAAERLHPDPPPPEPEMRPELLVIEPSSAAPGDIVELRFPEETMRGVAFQLDAETADGWETRYWLTSDGNGGPPSWVPVGTDGHGWPDVGVGGPGPDRVAIPDDVPPGRYRVCTANAGNDFCAPVEVVAGS